MDKPLPPPADLARIIRAATSDATSLADDAALLVEPGRTAREQALERLRAARRNGEFAATPDEAGSGAATEPDRP
ncbi:hypothetical protein [Embleya sp. NPDC020886]|uniref:hypothetical protein n=1 Tax=Embleya sp. NPDC020886 TaxID=3363980 RepID=UPI0037B54974